MRRPSLTWLGMRAAMPALHVILWLVLLCGTVSSVAQTGDENTCSTNCTCCINKTCEEDVVCEKNCKQGFRGINCTEPCPSGCFTCHRMFSENNTCSACKTGLYGDTCQLNCSRGCQDSKCDKETGVCSHGCVEYYTGDQCCTKGGNCSKCSSPSQCEICLGNFAGDMCELCKIGYHGDTCNKECKNCKENTCDKASGNCTQGCSGNFEQNRKGRCRRCNTGYWSLLCDKECPLKCDGKCKRKDGTCLKCQVGWNGNFCTLTCPNNCKNHICEQYKGTCLDGCRENFAGEKCEKCVAGRYGENCEKKCHNCKRSICSRATGMCHAGCSGNFTGANCSRCIDGTYGTACNQQCPRYCKDRACHQSTGKCSAGCSGNFTGANCNRCIDGTYGTACDQQCPRYCKDRACHQSTGKCSAGCSGNFTGANCNRCINGTYGTACKQQCPRYCRNRTCHRNTGNCLSGCINASFSGDKCCLQHKQGRCKTCSSSSSCLHCEVGYYGSACADSCSEGCYGRECDKGTGKCSQNCTDRYSGDRCCVHGGFCQICTNNTYCEECDDEYYGKICENRCPGKCADGKCDRSNGSCRSKCANSYFGVMCNQICPHNCNNQVCDKIEGSCKAGCNTSYYGAYCNQSCPPHCKNRICDIVNGSCTQGCSSGYTGDRCCLYKGHCKVCKTNEICAECLDGFYGKRCETPCPGQCADGKCEMEDGSCRLECRNGYHGAKCTKHCPRHCKHKACGKDTGSCTLGCRLDYYSGDKCCLYSHNGYCKTCSTALACAECKDGFYGPNCNERCSSHCNGTICKRYNGFCVEGCHEGYTGDMCCLKSGHCQSCASGLECDICKSGYYGELCNQTCSLGCRGNKCIKSNGRCSYSVCNDGYTGDRCCQTNGFCKICKSNDECEECQAGYFGKNCHENCPVNCNIKMCLRNGTCESCKKGYHGNYCKNRCPKQCANNKCRMNGTCYSCTRGFHAPDCSKSCSSTCQNNNCDRNGNCVSCIAGFYGKECELPCHEHCLTCVSATQCGKCKTGFYGEDCRSRCPSNCINCRNGGFCGACKSGYKGTTCNKTCSLCKAGTACGQSDGYCKVACKDGYSSTNCRQKCHSNCKICNRNNRSYCTSCAEGRYGRWLLWHNQQVSRCNDQCSTTCLHGLCDERTGHCFKCIGSFQGNLCNECREPLANPDKDCKCRTDLCLDVNCSSCRNSTWYSDVLSQSCCPCRNTCRNSTCSGKGVCTHGCVDGYYGYGCKRMCSGRQKMCEQCDYNYYKGYICKKCRTGFYPTKNQCSRCSAFCLNETCDPANGRCSYGCIEGRYGSKCGLRCGQFCNGDICSRDSGYCTEGCVSGYWGETCDNTCGPFCASKTCDRSNGQCVEGCNSGHWGKMCDKPCGQNCVNRTCDQLSGHCVEGCEKGHWGDTCNGTCVNHCELCLNNAECVRCEAGRYLTDCSSKCSGGCARIEDKLVCDIKDGSCTMGCRNERVFGNQCDLECSENCTGSECERLTGKCIGGCETGLYGEFCNNTCADTCMPVQQGTTCYDTNGTCNVGCLDGYYGDTCRDECSRNCVNGTCDQDSGSCLLGCLPGHRGSNCLKSLSATGPDDNLLSLAVPVIVVLLLVALLAAVVVVVIRKSRHTRSLKTGRHVPRDSDATLHEEPVPLADLNHAPTNDDEVVYANTAGPSTRIPVNGLLDYVVNVTREDYAEIYQTLPKGLIKPYQDSQKSESVPRNRYKTIYPYDFSRVKLHVEEGNNDYINASFIDGYKGQNEYIASLGPLARTTENFAIFWQMIWEQNVEKIVMLTNLQEPSGMKCEQYWPYAGTTVSYDVISVYGRNDDVYADYVIRHLMVTKGDETREVYHLHYIAWQDKTIPDDVISLLDFRHVTSSLPTKLEGPTVVHCSAGIGRTGTYMGLDILCKQTEKEDSVDVYACVMTMRENRVGMVQTAEQYMFLHRALAVYVTLGYQPIRSECFSEYVSILDDKRLQRMFADLEACRKLIDIETAAIDRNRQIGTNRACADIPGDKYRVRIRLERQHGTSSDYVNAVYLNSCAATNRYIVAQTPIQGGEEDFLALLLQERCSAIIDLDPVTSSDDEWMSLSNNKRRSKVNNFHISCSQMTASQKFSQRQLRLSLEGQTTVKELNVSLYQFKEWEKDASVPESPEDFVEFIRGVESAVRKSPENGPILLHCGTAGERSCLFYVVAIAIQRLETEHEVGVDSTVHQTRTRRRGAIPNKEQLMFCYQCVDAYLQSYETYSNFVA